MMKLPIPSFVHNVWNSLWQGMVNIIFPPFCGVCETKLNSDENVVCNLCWDKLEPTNLGNWRDQVTYHENLDFVLSGWYFDDTFQKIVHSLKYEEMKIVAHEFGKRLAHLFQKELASITPDLVVPVPLHQAKLRSRGFNQSTLIGQTIAKETNLLFDSTLLKRKKNTVSQTTLGVKERKLNVSDAFTVSSSVKYDRFLIVDDVLTSGATLSACATALKGKGATFIAVVTAGTPKAPVT